MLKGCGNVKVGIMQPYFFPYIGYWQLINAVDKFVIYDDVNFIKGGWINRNNILYNGKVKRINLQMNGASSNKLINEIEVSDSEIFRRKLLKTIEASYKKAPYFSETYKIIEDIVNNNEKNLAKYLEYSIRRISEYLLITTEIIMSSDINKNNELKGQDKVIEICQILGADKYYNAIGGQELYSREDFKKMGIELKFIKTNNISYNQFSHDFTPNLSIIDVMMFNSISEVNELLNEYTLI